MFIAVLKLNSKNNLIILTIIIVFLLYTTNRERYIKPTNSLLFYLINIFFKVDVRCSWYFYYAYIIIIIIILLVFIAFCKSLTIQHGAPTLFFTPDKKVTLVQRPNIPFHFISFQKHTFFQFTSCVLHNLAKYKSLRTEDYIASGDFLILFLLALYLRSVFLKLVMIISNQYIKLVTYALVDHKSVSRRQIKVR